MKRIKLIYNPKSGLTLFKDKLDEVIECFQNYGHYVTIFRTTDGVGLRSALYDLEKRYEAVYVSGGDGTVNFLINEMVKLGIDIPIGIFPYGTANDFATYLRIPRDIKACCKMLADNNIQPVDVGKINDRYFINIFTAGLLSTISAKTNTTVKNVFGKLAYHLKSIEELPHYRPIRLTVSHDKGEIDEELMLLLVLNSSFAGGFANVVPDAKVDDGFFDVVIIKNTSKLEALNILFSFLKGEHIKNHNLVHLKSKKLQISAKESIVTDIDGERGPESDITIENIQSRLRFLKP